MHICSDVSSLEKSNVAYPPETQEGAISGQQRQFEVRQGRSCTLHEPRARDRVTPAPFGPSRTHTTEALQSLEDPEVNPSQTAQTGREGLRTHGLRGRDIGGEGSGEADVCGPKMCDLSGARTVKVACAPHPALLLPLKEEASPSSRGSSCHSQRPRRASVRRCAPHVGEPGPDKYETKTHRWMWVDLQQSTDRKLHCPLLLWGGTR
ncbi:hypothetical protein EYF80_003762 [Liparis tanakae]|uniref:Uncharacterized protein n=1 Tax=Liparis tanakae TaxID=230148 RepID=A0A4Z2J886_9TELE|nr:hypothetical protein EYF80_003762 [Liparis tanakae]